MEGIWCDILTLLSKGSMRPGGGGGGAGKSYVICTTIFSLIKTQCSKHVATYNFKVEPYALLLQSFPALVI